MTSSDQGLLGPVNPRAYGTPPDLATAQSAQVAAETGPLGTEPMGTRTRGAGA